MPSSFDQTITKLEKEVAALKAEKLKASSTLETVLYQRTLSFTVKSDELTGQLVPTQLATVTATASGGENLVGMLGVAPADDDGRVSVCVRIPAGDGKIAWKVAPMLFLNSDYDGIFDDSGNYTEKTFSVSYRVTLTVSSKCSVAVSYEDYSS